METDMLQPGQTIKLTTDSRYYREVYESTLLSVYNSVVEISSPIYNGIYVPLNTGCGLDMEVRTTYGACRLTGIIKERFIGKHSLLVELENPKNPKETGNGKTCRFITVTSGKGGVGKTVFLINYGVALARSGKKVVIIDADLGMANVDVLLKLSPRYNLIDVINGSRSLKSIILKGPGGISFIPGGSGIQELSNLSPEEFKRITSGFEHLEQEYDYVLMDTGAGLSKNVTEFVFVADETIVVTTPEPHAITDAYSLVKVILDRSKSISLKLLVNRCRNGNEAGRVMEKMSNVIRRFLDYEMGSLGFMVECGSVGKSIREQSPFVLSYPFCEASRNIWDIAGKYCGQNGYENSHLSGFISRFSNIFMRQGPET